MKLDGYNLICEMIKSKLLLNYLAKPKNKHIADKIEKMAAQSGRKSPISNQ